MAYPFAQWPTLAGFIARVKADFKGVEIQPKPVLFGPRGPTTIVGLKVGERVAILPEDDGRRMPPSVVRSLCNRLGIDPEVFGFTLSDWDEDPDPPN